MDRQDSNLHLGFTSVFATLSYYPTKLKFYYGVLLRQRPVFYLAVMSPTVNALYYCKKHSINTLAGSNTIAIMLEAIHIQTQVASENCFLVKLVPSTAGP